MTDDEALDHLKSRGVPPAVVEVIRALLPTDENPQRQQEAPKLGSRNQRISMGSFRSARRKPRYSPQRECVLAAIDLIYPDGVPRDLLSSKLKRQVIARISTGQGEPWHQPVSDDTVSDHVDAYLSQLRDR